jgi:HSP20 family protein
MPITNWDPLGDATALQDKVNRMFEEIFPRTAESSSHASCAWTPQVDIYRTDEGIAITADLPGVSKKDVLVEIKNNVITLKGQRVLTPDIADERYFRKERCFGGFHRSFTLKFLVPPDKIKATFKNGVLTIQLPLPEPQESRQVKISID